MTSTEKVAYLKGLMEGMELNRESGEGKLFAVIADVLGEMAEDIEDLESDLYDLSEDVDAISDDLSDVEDTLRHKGGSGFDEDEDDEDEDDYYGDEYSDEDEDGEPQFFEITCPSCEKTMTVDEDVLELGKIQCPNCGEMLEFDFDDLIDFDGERGGGGDGKD